MSIHKQDKVFDDEQIRDTASKTSSVADLKGFDPKTIMFCNGLDQSVDIDIEGSNDSSFTHVWPIDETIAVGASVCSYATLNDYFPYIRMKAQCATAPSSGGLDVWVMKRT